MKKLTLLATFAAALFAGKEAKAQDAQAVLIHDSLIYEKPLLQRPLSASLHLGTQGIGASAKLAIKRQINVRVGFSYLPVSHNMEFKLSGYTSDVKLSSAFGNVHVLGEYRPFAGSSFRVVGGLAYFFAGEAKADLQPKGTYKFGDIPVSGQQVGKVEGTIDWKGIAPYLGIGLFNSMPTKKFNVTLDLGTYYLSAPEVTIDGTNMLKDNKDNEPVVEDNLKGYRWMPVMQVNFNYRIN